MSEEAKPAQKIPDIYQLIVFVKDYSWEWNDLTDKQVQALEADFKQAFQKLPALEQQALLLEAQALSNSIKILPDLNPGVAIMRQTDMADRVNSIMERAGVIGSTKEGGLERTKEKLAALGEDTLGYLIEYEIFAKTQAEKPEVASQVTYVLNIISGIRSEIERLKLADASKSQPKGELARRRDSKRRVKTSISKLGNELDSALSNEELIGFCTLNELLKEFHNAKRYFEDAVLQLENPVEPMPTIS